MTKFLAFLIMYSKESYRRLLDAALQQGYTFAGFLDNPDGSGQSEIYLRHDVDYSLQMACELASINASAGVQGTFFLLLRSQIYNLLSHWSLDRVREIQGLNQRIAFHFALPVTLPPHFDAIIEQILRDFEMVKRHIPEIEPVFSWHNPTASVLSCSSGRTAGGLVNVYSECFTRTIPYFSDSNMRYSVQGFEEIIEKRHKKLHMLMHPFNWIAGGTSMEYIFAKTWQYVIKEREHEIRLNERYQNWMPQGMPTAVIEKFSNEWLNAAIQKTK